MTIKLPAVYDSLSRTARRVVRDQYISDQKGLCWYCKADIRQTSPHETKKTKVRWWRFPGEKKGFLRWPIHLHHDHNTGLTLGVVHAYCNAVSFDYDESP